MAARQELGGRQGPQCQPGAPIPPATHPQQTLQAAHVAIEGSEVQWGTACIVLLVHLRAVLHHREVTVGAKARHRRPVTPTVPVV